ncbi:MAG: HAD-IIA family hydrolase [Clostridia bacterium]|nr:HAD-IIA family hydrolase [Clostridia bacterium]
MSLSEKKLFLLDMDGTIYLDDTLFDGTVDFLRHVKEKGGRYIFLTNNSSRGTDAYVAKMARLGIQASADDFVSSADATIMYLKKKYRDDTVFYVCGTESLKDQLRKAGLTIAESASGYVSVVLLGYDTELTYEKLENCCRLLNRGCDYVATHPDLVCPVSYGYAPDCGSVIQMLKTATGREPVVIGKPQPEMADYAMQKVGVSKEETALMGDRLYTDILCGVNAGIDTIFVLSGEGTMEDIDKYGIKPAYIFNGIRQVLDEIIKEENREA